MAGAIYALAFAVLAVRLALYAVRGDRPAFGWWKW